MKDIERYLFFNKAMIQNILLNYIWNRIWNFLLIQQKIAQIIDKIFEFQLKILFIIIEFKILDFKISLDKQKNTFFFNKVRLIFKNINKDYMKNLIKSIFI